LEHSGGAIGTTTTCCGWKVPGRAERAYADALQWFAEQVGIRAVAREQKL